VWLTLLLDKYLFGRPTSRLLEDLRRHGLDLSLGTGTDGLRRLAPLFEPLYEGLIRHQRQEHHGQADETRWRVFATLEGKVGHRCYLWAVQSEQTVVFLLDPSRSHDAPERLLAPQSLWHPQRRSLQRLQGDDAAERGRYPLGLVLGACPP
jgi:hypothetical protein